MGDYDSTNPADQTRKGWLTSILELGAWVGTLLSGFLAEQYSRKISIIIATGVFIIGVVVQATAVRYIPKPVHVSNMSSPLTTLQRWSFIYPRRQIYHRYGCRFTLHDCPHVQCRMRTT